MSIVAVIDHVGWAVRSIDDSRHHFEMTLGLKFVGEEGYPGLRLAFFGEGPAQVELLEPLDSSSDISAFLAQRGEGIHHIAVRVDDVGSALAAAGRAGARLIDQAPRHGARGTTVGFIDPQRADGVLVQYVQQS